MGLTRRSCSSCGAVLSRLAGEDEFLCCSCHSRQISLEEHLEYLDRVAQARGERLFGEDVCKRGHDLRIHGAVFNAGGGRLTRRCVECRKMREREYQRERRRRLKEAA